MEHLEKLFVAAGQLVSAKGNPIGFAALVAILLTALVVLLFQKAKERTRLIAFAALLVSLVGIVLAVVIPPRPTLPPDPRPPEPQVPAASGSSGWVYYEVGQDGRPTPDGQLQPLPPGRAMPDFAAVKRGDMFRILSAVRLRAAPSGTGSDAAPVAILGTGTCVGAAADAEIAREVKVRQARSGGWLRVAVQPCP